MNRKIISEYLKTLVFAVVATLDVHDLWQQTVDGDGAAAYAYQTGSGIPGTYLTITMTPSLRFVSYFL